MFKKLLSLTLVVLLMQIGFIQPIAAGSNPEKDAKFAEKVKTGIAKLGTGAEARIEVKLKNKTKLKGYISQTKENSFVIVEDNTGVVTEVPYSNAKQIKGNNLSKGAIAVIAVGVAFAVIVISLVALGKQNN